MSDILMKGTEPIGQVCDLTADNVEYSSGVSVKIKIDSKLENFQYVNTYTKSSSVTGGNYPTNAPFLVQVKYSSQGCDSKIFYDKNMLGGTVVFNIPKTLATDSQIEKIYFNQYGAFDMSNCTDGLTVAFYTL